jgi:ferredoxin--NADP+ reductase
LNVNDTVYLQKPRGVFTIEETKPDGSPETRQMILVASGTGLAPFISYILYLKKTINAKKIVLIHGASYPQELGYKEFLEDLASQHNYRFKFDYIPTISRPNDPLSKNWGGNTGRVDSLISGIENHSSRLEKILGSEITPQNSFFYLCGYDKMIDDISEMLLPLGFVDIRHKRKDGSFDFKYEYGF